MNNMNLYNNCLDIIFRLTSPELLYDKICNDEQFLNPDHTPVLGAALIGEKEFIRFAQQSRSGMSQEELENTYQLIRERMKLPSWLQEQPIPLISQSIFYLLTVFTEKTLSIAAEEPIARSEHLLEWRDISFRLGQDIFTTAHLALHDEVYLYNRTFFSWATIIHTDDMQFRALMKSGVAENHFHLGGSTRNFILSWICLMNHPEKIHSYFQQKSLKKFAENLDSRLILHASEYQMSWTDRLRLASWIRVNLFHKLHNPSFQLKSETFSNPFTIRSELKQLVSLERFCQGKQFQQPNGKKVCLDYAITSDFIDCTDTRNDNFNRILSGERWFLYRCFRSCFSGAFSSIEQDLFYLYLLIYTSLRGELVQLNQRVGFYNFAAYQNRKSDFFQEFPEYYVEAHRIAVNGSIHDNFIQSLEARIMPQNTVQMNKSNLEYIDRNVIFAKQKKKKTLTHMQIEKKSKKLKHFYVFHFAKKKWIPSARFPDDSLLALPRNYKQRQIAQKQALALAKLLSIDDYACTRIRGIDACSSEIGCRPETFATEFRFLRSFEPIPRHQPFFDLRAPMHPRLGATYHAGEDFLDIMDGIRAIDEAIFFLNLKRGDRIGHALALGISPEIHYKRKNNLVITTMQDRLDDIIWLLYRSQELHVMIPSALYRKLEAEAQSLLARVYGEIIREYSISLRDYYESWKLRGNHPDLYKTLSNTQVSDNFLGYLSLRSQYEMHKQNIHTYSNVNASPAILALLHSYHYDIHVQKNGIAVYSFSVDQEYISVVHAMQDGLKKSLIHIGIGVECNPSSNVLISTFQSYSNHPIFRFNGFNLNSSDNNAECLSISINTDDQGIFDTSLENEYALLAASLKAETTSDGKRKYSDDAIYQYLNHIRLSGIYQTFPATTTPI